MSDTYTSIDVRYQSAWLEVNQRIALRQNAITTYVTLMASLVVAIFLVKDKNISFASDLMLVAIPLLSISFSLLNFKHDQTIQHLRSFLAKCESVNVNLEIPAYHLDSFWKRKADAFRLLHDFACLVLVFIYNSIGVIAIYKQYGTYLRPDSYLTGLFIVVAFAPLVIVVWPAIQHWKKRRLAMRKASEQNR